MQLILSNVLDKREDPINIILVGMGFIGFGVFSALSYNDKINVAVLITRRPKDVEKELKEKGFKVGQIRSATCEPCCRCALLGQ